MKQFQATKVMDIVTVKKNWIWEILNEFNLTNLPVYSLYGYLNVFRSFNLLLCYSSDLIFLKDSGID